jgi:hypothetical protein
MGNLLQVVLPSRMIETRTRNAQQRVRQERLQIGSHTLISTAFKFILNLLDHSRFRFHIRNVRKCKFLKGKLSNAHRKKCEKIKNKRHD